MPQAGPSFKLKVIRPVEPFGSRQTRMGVVRSPPVWSCDSKPDVADQREADSKFQKSATGTQEHILGPDWGGRVSKYLLCARHGVRIPPVIPGSF